MRLTLARSGSFRAKGLGLKTLLPSSVGLRGRKGPRTPLSPSSAAAAVDILHGAVALARRLARPGLRAATAGTPTAPAAAPAVAGEVAVDLNEDACISVAHLTSACFRRHLGICAMAAAEAGTAAAVEALATAVLVVANLNLLLISLLLLWWWIAAGWKQGAVRKASLTMEPKEAATAPTAAADCVA